MSISSKQRTVIHSTGGPSINGVMYSCRVEERGFGRWRVTVMAERPADVGQVAFTYQETKTFWSKDKAQAWSTDKARKLSQVVTRMPGPDGPQEATQDDS